MRHADTISNSISFSFAALSNCASTPIDLDVSRVELREFRIDLFMHRIELHKRGVDRRHPGNELG